MSTSWDVFFSYRRHDLARAQPLLDALAEAGVRVWRDERDIPDQGSITSEIRHGIANSKALLAFYSSTYPMSSPCQQEITTAWLAGQQIDHTANRRVWLINPEASFEHIPELLRDQELSRVTGGCSQFAAIAQGLKDRLGALDATLLGKGFRELPSYYGMSPVQARLFIGRAAELWDLHGKLTANRISIISGVYGQAAAQVRGLGGNGKSLLAHEYSIRFGPAYPGGVFWLNAYGHDYTRGSVSAEQREALRQDQIREFAIQCGVPTKDLKPGEIETSLWRTIEKRGERCLWIVDDVPSGLNPAELDRAWYARWTGSSTLITTRSKEYGAVGSALDLGVLSSREAFDLLCSHRRPQGPSEAAAALRIVEFLGCHPLAVEVAASYLAEGFDTMQGYLDALANPGEDAVEFGAVLQQSLPTGHERSISTTLLTSIRRLGPEGLDFLRLASILAVAPIQVSFIAEVFGILGHPKIRSVQAATEVEALSLCERSVENARTVHALVGRTVRFQYPVDERTARLRAAAVQALTRRLEIAEHVGDLPKVAVDLPHARHLVRDELRTANDVWLTLIVGATDQERADFVSARKLQEQAFDASRQLLGGDHRVTLTAMHALAQTLFAQGDFAGARKCEGEMVDRAQRHLGKEHPITLSGMHGLAQTLYAQGDLTESRKLDEQVLEIRRRVLGDKHKETLISEQTLARTLRAQGSLARARTLQENVLDGLRNLLGQEHPTTIRAMHDLAFTLWEQDDLAGARVLQEQVLAAQRRLLGEEHPDTLGAMHHLAISLQCQGDLAAACNLQEQVLQGSRRALGEAHPDTLNAMHNLAGTLYAQRDLARARSLQEQVLQARHRLLGEEHPDTLSAMHNLGQTLYGQGHLAEARLLQQQVLDLRRHAFGVDHPDTLSAMQNLAVTLYAIGDLDLALSLQEQVLERCRRLQGETHRNTVTAMKNLDKMRARKAGSK